MASTAVAQEATRHPTTLNGQWVVERELAREDRVSLSSGLVNVIRSPAAPTRCPGRPDRCLVLRPRRAGPSMLVWET
jgi:hypothetical protein